MIIYEEMMVYTLDNNKRNLDILYNNGYKKSNVSKSNCISKSIRVDSERLVFWFSNVSHEISDARHIIIDIVVEPRPRNIY